MSGNGYDYPYSTGGGGTNPTSLRMPINVGGVFLDSLLYEDATRRILAATNGLYLNTNIGVFQLGDIAGAYANTIINVTGPYIATEFLGEPKGLYVGLDNSTGNKYALGDFGGKDNGSSFLIDDANQLITTGKNLKTVTPLFFGLFVDTNSGDTTIGDKDYIFPNALNFVVSQTGVAMYSATAGSQLGLLLDFGLNSYGLGDTAFTNNGTNFIVNVANSTIYSNYSGNPYGLKIDAGNGLNYLGDFNNDYNGNAFVINDTTNIVDVNHNGLPNGFRCDFSTNRFYIGDFQGQNNNTWQIIDDTQQWIEYSANLITGTAGGNSGQQLKIYINGNQYRIQLLNP